MKKNRILLIEDNEDDIELIIMSLEQRNIANEINIVKDGEQALNYMFRKGEYEGKEYENPIFILLDINIPKINGLEVLKQIKANPLTKRIPVAIFTSSNQEEDIARGYEYGANSFIRKPVDYDKFREAINNLGMYWLLLNELPPDNK